MTTGYRYSLPEIKLSHNQIAIIKIVIVLSIFLVIAINVLAAKADAMTRGIIDCLDNITYACLYEDDDDNDKFLSGTNVTDVTWGLDNSHLFSSEEKEEN